MPYVEMIYELVKETFVDFDAIYEDALIQLIGTFGISVLQKHGLIEGCGIVNCRRLYVLCDKD